MTRPPKNRIAAQPVEIRRQACRLLLSGRSHADVLQGLRRLPLVGDAPSLASVRSYRQGAEYRAYAAKYGPLAEEAREQAEEARVIDDAISSADLNAATRVALAEAVAELRKARATAADADQLARLTAIVERCARTAITLEQAAWQRQARAEVEAKAAAAAEAASAPGLSKAERYAEIRQRLVGA
jgi:hypothetical protein